MDQDPTTSPDSVHIGKKNRIQAIWEQLNQRPSESNLKLTVESTQISKKEERITKSSSHDCDNNGLLSGKLEGKKDQTQAIWEQLNRGPSKGNLKPLAKGSTVVQKEKKGTKSSPPEWMISLGLACKKPAITQVKVDSSGSQVRKDIGNNDGKKLAAEALAAAKEVSMLKKEGKIEVSEVKDFAGEEVKITKYLDPSSKAGQALKRKEEMMASSNSGLDKLLQQIGKKAKLNVIDKSRKDWSEFKEGQGLEEELEIYKKSGGKYTERVAFLERADLRQFEIERDARLALQAKRHSTSAPMD